MRKISSWAKLHPVSAQIIIVSSFLVLNILGYSTGLLLRETGISLPFITILFFICLYAVGFIAYPFKVKRTRRRVTPVQYLQQKTCDLLLAGSSFLMIVYFGNHREVLFRYSLPFTKAMASTPVLPRDSVSKTYKSIADFSVAMKDAGGKMLHWKERKKILKEQVRAIKKADDLSAGAKAGLIILSVAVALGLIYLIAALACNLSCGGSDVAAVIVGIGGTGLVIFLLVVVIRKILGKKGHQKKSAGNENIIIQEALAGAEK